MSGSTPAPRSRRRLVVIGLVAALAVALPVGGFLAYGAYTRSGEIVYDRGGDVFGADASPLPALDGGTGQDTAPGGVAGATHAPLPTIAVAPTGAVPTGAAPAGTAAPGTPGKGAAAPAAPASTDTKSGTRSGAGKPAATAVKTAARNQPFAGTYPLTVAGKENVTFGPFSFCGRNLPDASALVVAPAQNEPAGSYNFDVRYFPGETGKHDERHIYRYANGAVDLAFESATVTCSGVRQGSDVSYSPVQRCIVAPLKVGATWSGTGGDADRTEKYTSTVTGTDIVTVAGLRVPVFVIDTRTTFTGSESGERSRRWWYAPSLAMPVKWTDTTSGGRSGAKYSNEITVTVAGLPDAAAAVLGAAGR